MKYASPSEKLLGFHIHAVVFVATMALLVAITLWTDPHLWAHWPLLSWGTGLLAHWWFALGPGAGAARGT